jgi:DNA-binding CsgD family transcriptional regulator
MVGVTGGEVERAIARIADAAQLAAVEIVRRQALAEVDRLVGIDVGFGWSATGGLGSVSGFGITTEATQLLERRREAFQPTVSRLLAAAAAGGGAVLDDRVFDGREMASQPLYQEMGACLASRRHMTVCLSLRGRVVGGLYLGRGGARARPFTDEDLALVRRLVPVLSLAEGAPSGDDGVAELTAREREVLGLFTVGATYAEVGRALGVSINTVRQHVRAMYEKLHVASKAEAVMRWR